jgi:hypothetical protein
MEEYQKSGQEAWFDCFDSVLFPLLEELMNSETFFLDPLGMDETRMRACALLCKIFLHFLPGMIKTKELVTLWDRVLYYMLKYMQLVGKNDYLVILYKTQCQYEGVVESLKNMLLVLSTQHIFQPESIEGQEVNLWDSTWTKLNPILPKLQLELFPKSPRPSVTGSNAIQVSDPQETQEGEKE